MGGAADPIAEAEAELNAAEARLGRFARKSSLGTETPIQAGVPGPTSTTGPPGQAEPAPAPPGDRVVEGVKKSEPDEQGFADTCETACDALNAMRKAADRVCDLAPGERCDTARARVADAEKRVMEACPECEA